MEKLKIFPDEIDGARCEAAATLRVEGLAGVATVAARRQRIDVGLGAIHHPARAGTAGRARGHALKAEGIPTAIYYAKPLHRQAAYREFPVAGGGLPVSERLADEVISLPMHAYLDAPDPGSRR